VKNRKAFTLIELLVVISIIALLVSILMPALRKAKIQAWTVVCKSNLHQYALGVRMYLDENDGAFPCPFTWLYKDGSGGCRWHDASANLDSQPELGGELWPYLERRDVHLCPTFNSAARSMGCGRCDAYGVTLPIEPQYSYTMNAYLGGVWATSWYDVPPQFQAAVKYSRKESQVKNPASVFVFSEENTWNIPGISTRSVNDNNLRAKPPSDNMDCFATYHNAPGGDLNEGFANAVFVDGHVEEVSAYPAENTFALSWPGGKPIPDW